jgi:transcription elongation factor GreA
MKDIYLTKEGVEKLQAELKQLIEVERREVIKKLSEAREYGDLSENSEYEAARERQSLVEGKIEEIEAILKIARIVDPTKAKASGKASLGTTVEVEVEGDKEKFVLVGSAESDPSVGRISVESPIGKALLGTKAGDNVEVPIPDGSTVAYKVLSVS